MGGLNVIQAPNEGGKSTWAGFLKSMLYGIDTRDRDKKGYLADKNRYQPWSGAPMEGEMTLEWGGREITIRRFKQGNAPFAGFSAVYTGTQEPVPELTAASCGQLLVGAEREVYERSAFIGQSGVAVTAVPELERRIAALATTGEEDVSYSQAEGRLREWGNRRRVNKTVGLIPRLEGELAQTEDKLARLERTSETIAHCTGERAALERAKQELEGERELHRRLKQRELNARFAQAQEELDAAQGALDALRRQRDTYGPLPERDLLKRAQGELQYLKVLDGEIGRDEAAVRALEQAAQAAAGAASDPRFPGMTGDEAAQKAGEVRRAWEQDMERADAFRRRAKLGLAALGAAAVCLAAFLCVHFAIGNELSILRSPVGLGPCVAAVLGAGTAVFCLLRSRGAGADAAALLGPWGVDSPEGLEKLAQDYRERRLAADEAARRVQEARRALEHQKARRESGQRDLLGFVRTFAPETDGLLGCSAALSRALGLEDELRAARERLELTRRRRDDLAAQGGQPFQTLELLHQPENTPEQTERALAQVSIQLSQVERELAAAQGEQRSTGDPAALAARREELREELERRKLELQAITTALEALKAANARLQERFSPELNRLAGAWMERLTGGKYAAVSLTRELEASAAGGDSLLPRRAIALSRGTADQLYLAVRLAVCQLCLPGDSAPLVLDDALVNFDDARLALALDALAELGRERQILLFTCQGRERAALAGRKDAVFLTLS